MSYARFGYDRSDVYVYLDVGGYFCCCGCAFGNDRWRHDDTDAIVAHLREHEVAGHQVPPETYAELESDRGKNDEWISEYRAAHPAVTQTAPPSPGSGVAA